MNERRLSQRRGVFRVSASLLFLFVGCSSGDTESRALPEALFFYSPGCPKCQDFRDLVLPRIEPLVSRIEWVNVTTDEGISLFLDKSTKMLFDLPQMAPVLVYQGAVYCDVELALNHLDSGDQIGSTGTVPNAKNEVPRSVKR